MTFTPEQIRNFNRYEKVRKSGLFNMFDPRARKLAGLTMEDYFFVMKYYSNLKVQAEREGYDDEDGSV